VALWGELVVVREMVAALRKGRSAPLAASAVEEAVPAAGLCRMWALVRESTFKSPLINT